MPKYGTTTAFAKIAQMKGEVRVVQGGKGASKTISILQLLAFMIMSKREDLIISVVAQSLPNLKSGALRDWDNLLKDMGVMNKFKINRTNNTYEYNSNLIEFFSVDSEASRLGSRRTHLYVNEADGLNLDTFLELQGRTSGFTIVDFNPRRRFWIHDDFVGQKGVDFIKLTYKDNEYIPPKELQSLLFYKTKAEETKSPYWINKWRVLGLGELGVVEGVIFQEGRDYHIIEELPTEARYIGAGLDFGFSHVTAIVKLYEYIDLKGDNYIILKESLFQAGLTTPRIVKHIKQDEELMSSVIVADSARPEMVTEMRAYGIPILGHKKRDVNSGIDLMFTYNILLTGESENMINEFRQYAWATDKDGKPMGVPSKAMDVDNSIDATRYAFEHFLSKTKSRTNMLKWVV